MKTFPFLLLSLALAVHLPAAPATVYQCPMHPWIKSDKPGDKCTICGMELVAAAMADSNGAADPNLVALTPASASVVGVQTATVNRTTLVRTLRVAGLLDDDDTRHRIIAARVPGRVDKLYINYVGEEVREGEPLATIYSPEMLTAQRQYVERLKANGVYPVSERAAAREHLLDLGLTEEEVTILEHTLEPTAMVNIRAPGTGTIVARQVYEGQELNKDQAEKETRLFEFADFSSMWFVFEAYEPDLAWLRVGQQVEISVASQPGVVLTAPIAFIDPNMNELTRTARVRVVLPNQDHALRHKQTGYGRVRLEIPDLLVAPRSAVLQHGADPIVFLQQKDRAYLARRVQLGRIGDDTVEILGGLREGDRVVTEGGLLLDGQAQLARAAISGESPLVHANGMAKPAMTSPSGDNRGYARLTALAFVTADASAALATDDFAAYKMQLPGLRAALQAYLDGHEPAGHGPLARYITGLPDRDDLRTARRDFETFSTALTDLAREQHLPAREGLHVFQCPMSPVLGLARWLSRGPAPRNPFFGSAMPECGDELDQPAAAILP